MRISQEAIGFWVFVLKWATRVLACLSVLAGALIRFKASSLGFVSDESNDEAIQKLASIALPLLLLLVPLAEAIRRRLERVTLKPLVKEIADEFRKQIYPANTEPAHHHRVTLFKRCGWVMRRRFFRERRLGWLKIVDRSGHTTQSSRTVFFAPSDNPDLAEGVAGAAWAWKTVVYVEDLPDLRSPSVKDRQIIEYAKKTNSPVNLIRGLVPTSRSLCGIPVEVGGVVWGVLVVDSRNAKLPKELIELHYPLVAKFMGRILERLT